MELNIQIASVKVMRSYDYCHFEVCLSSSDATTPEKVDELRKTAARLADKAVKQYQTAKEDESNRLAASCNSIGFHAREAAKIEAIAETDRTPEEQAQLKAFKDAEFRASRPGYDYEDDWQDDYSASSY